MRTLEIPSYAAIGILESLWNLCAREAPQGNIGKLSDADIADQIGWDLDPAPLIEGLVQSGWLDRHSEHRVIVHDWRDHADDAVDNALTRAHLRYADGSIPRMNRLSKNERESAIAFYLQPVRTDAHEMPLPEPSQSLARAGATPEPEATPVAVATTAAALHDPPALDHVDVARRVGEECRITSPAVIREIQEQAKLELVDRPPEDVAAELTASIEAYRAEKPRLRITWGLEKFIGEGHWRDPTSWPRKDLAGKDIYQQFAESDA
jgi:hypothetical protein